MAVSSFKFYTETDVSATNEKEIGTQGLRKRILRHGNSWKTPSLGDEVEVHYSGCIVGGSSFDSSWERGTPFRFKLGQCEVIKGWDDGIATMKKGERAVFTIPPNLAYGEAGLAPKIPPSSTLVFAIELLSWTTIIDVSGDGGILKKIVREGGGWATPRDADEVLVKYEARIEDGTIISKSDVGVEFYVNGGYLCPAVSKAVKTMRKGEKAELLVKLSYGIGSNEIEDTTSVSGIPSNATLSIDLELVSWKSVIDVTEDKRVLKKIIREGEGFDHPNEGSLVKVIYSCRLEDGTVCDSKGSEDEPLEYLCFQEQIHEGLDRAIVTMRKGEKALVTINSGESFNNVVFGMAPASITALYDVELISFTKEKPCWKMETREKIEACERKKDEGNKLFKAAKFWCASIKYNKAVKCIELDHSFTNEEKNLANALRISSNLNNAACKLKLGEFAEAAKLCTKVLELDPFNLKALFRRSQSYLRISELEKAEIDIKRALSIHPNSRDVKLEYAKLKAMKREYAKYDAEIFGTMFSKMGLSKN